MLFPLILILYCGLYSCNVFVLSIYVRTQLIRCEIFAFGIVIIVVRDCYCSLLSGCITEGRF